MNEFEKSLGRFYQSTNGEEFKENLIEAGSHVHTDEQLRTLRKAIEKVQPKVLMLDPSFKELIERRRTNIKEKMESEERARRSRVDAKVRSEVSKAESMSSRYMNQYRDKLREVKKFKSRSLEEAKAKPLFCPVCGERRDQENNRNQDDGLICIRHRHILVPENDLKKYNRAYRRNWKRSHS